VSNTQLSPSGRVLVAISDAIEKALAFGDKDGEVLCAAL